MTRRLTVEADGGSRGNPGVAGYGALVRDTATAEIDAEVELLTAQRSTQVSGVDDGLVTLYEKIRAQQGGVGAAELKQRRCGGCRLELNNVEIGRLRDAPEDEVLRCEECRRILVRTAESGL